MTHTDCELVMVVEDDRDVRESIIEVLEDNAYRALTAANGQDALAQLANCATLPCVILLDMMMPIMDGRQFRMLQQVSPALCGIPVVIITAHADLEADAAELQVAAILKKPIQLSALMSIIGRFCQA